MASESLNGLPRRAAQGHRTGCRCVPKAGCGWMLERRPPRRSGYRPMRARPTGRCPALIIGIAAGSAPIALRPGALRSHVAKCVPPRSRVTACRWS